MITEYNKKRFTELSEQVENELLEIDHYQLCRGIAKHYYYLVSHYLTDTREFALFVAMKRMIKDPEKSLYPIIIESDHKTTAKDVNKHQRFKNYTGD